MSKTKRLAIVGAGAAGFFAAINAKEKNSKLDVVLFETREEGLRKVKISGGGRCNVTHHAFEVNKLVPNYPRGSRELRGPFNRFQPKDTVEWFEKRGIELKTEADGRMFPSTNSSQTIVDCFIGSAKSLGVDIRYESRVSRVERGEAGFKIISDSNESEIFDYVLLSTGSTQDGFKLAEGLGHSIVPLVPSLFTFKVDDPEIHALAGISVPNVEVKVSAGRTTFSYKGPLLFVHWGISGPGVLKLSAFAANELHELKYRCPIIVRFYSSREEVQKTILTQRENSANAKVLNRPGFDLPKRLFQLLAKRSCISEDMKWADLTKSMMNALVENLTNLRMEMSGKTTFKEEFVTCGGVDLKEVDFRRMESKICPGLFFAGEILNIDGITGGFNFQNAWTGAYLVAQSVSE